MIIGIFVHWILLHLAYSYQIPTDNVIIFLKWLFSFLLDAIFVLSLMFIIN